MASIARDEDQIGEALRYLAGESRNAGLDDLGMVIECVIPDRPGWGMPGDQQLDLGALATFVAVAEAGTFTAAAERLGITQAAVSFQIGRLEDNLGSRLFERGARGATLLEPGQRLMPYARALLNLSRAARRALAPEPANSRASMPMLRFPQAVPGE